MLGPTAEFRDGQLEAIRAVVEDRRRVLVVQRTGWGKSIVYFIATRLLRDRGAGLTLIVSPLLALMRDQIRMAEILGIRALTINSSNNDDWQAIEDKLRAGECDLLLVSPERLANQRFHEQTLPAMGDFGLFVVDEAHCISDWGHAFRPDYRRIERIIRTLPLGTPVLATTATANDRVIADVQEQLGAQLAVLRGPLARESLQLQVVQLADQAERLAWLAQHLDLLTGSGIIYCLTKPDTLRVAEWLRRHGYDAEAYNADLDTEERVILEDRLRDNDVRALVATVALGMGFDKPDLGFVVHFQAPGSIVAYYQQIGRAGRALPDAYAVLLAGEEDQTINQYFIDSTFPPYEQLQDIVELIEQAEDGIKPAEIEAHLNIRHGQLETALKMLEVDGVVQKQGGRHFRTANPFTYDEERVARVTGQRQLELAQMRDYVDLGDCLMEFVARALDDREARPCGRCASCSGPSLPSEVDRRLVQEAVDFLRRASLAIEPRKKVPYTLAFNGKSWIPAELRCERGVALCQYADAGWGRVVQIGKYDGVAFSDELVAAGAALIRETWQVASGWWVTSVPSLRHPTLVGDFAERLAQALGLPSAPVVRQMRETQPQKELLNSAQLAHNVATAFAVDPLLVARGPVILVDDVVDSRWTMTWCGIRLRQAGSGPVYPFALADAQGGGR
jgi:ATP-dependent DNA helicase RecQ